LFKQPLGVMQEMEAAEYVAEVYQERAAAVTAGKIVEWTNANPDKAVYCVKTDQWLGDE